MVSTEMCLGSKGNPPSIITAIKRRLTLATRALKSRSTSRMPLRMRCPVSTTHREDSGISVADLISSARTEGSATLFIGKRGDRLSAPFVLELPIHCYQLVQAQRDTRAWQCPPREHNQGKDWSLYHGDDTR